MDEKDKLLLHLKKKEKELGRAPKRSEIERQIVSKINKVFDSYSSALFAAGIKPLRFHKPTEEFLINSLKEFYKENGRSPNFADSNTTGLSDPNVFKKTLNCETWSDVLRKAGLPVYRIRKMYRSVPQDLVDSEILRVAKLLEKTPSIEEMKEHTGYGLRILTKNEKYNNRLLRLGLKIRDISENCELSNDELLNLYRDVSLKNGLYNGATTDQINELFPYKTDVFIYRFGSISKLRQLAGFATGRSRLIYTEKMIIDLIQKKTIEYNQRITQQIVKNDPEFPSMSTVNRHLSKGFLNQTAECWEKLRNKD